MTEISESQLKATLYKHDLNKTNAAKELGVKKQNINHYLDKYNLEVHISKELREKRTTDVKWKNGAYADPYGDKKNDR